MDFIDIQPTATKAHIFEQARDKLAMLGFTITEVDDQRPWGGYIRISEEDADQFIRTFYQSKVENQNLPQTPKVLFIAPHQRLSWQYHKRRREVWRVLNGPVKVIQGMTDNEQNESLHEAGDVIEFQTEQRHRMVGLDNWGVWVEIWQHTDKDNPSTEHEDNYRIQDDYGR